jgi:hypothetical protein
MKGTSSVAVLLVLLATACGGEGADVPTASSVPPDDMPACEEIYAEGNEIDDATFGLACVKGDDLISPRPVRIECTDGDELLFNDLAWGYYGEPMTMTPDDDPSKMPVTAVDECLAPQPSGATTTTTSAFASAGD